MAKSGENLPLDKNWKPDVGARGQNHVYRDGEYVEVPYVFQEYPKQVGDQVVENAEQEAELRKEKKK